MLRLQADESLWHITLNLGLWAVDDKSYWLEGEILGGLIQHPISLMD
jgi:hypothetical protein